MRTYNLTDYLASRLYQIEYKYEDNKEWLFSESEQKSWRSIVSLRCEMYVSSYASSHGHSACG